MVHVIFFALNIAANNKQFLIIKIDVGFLKMVQMSRRRRCNYTFYLKIIIWYLIQLYFLSVGEKTIVHAEQRYWSLTIG